MKIKTVIFNHNQCETAEPLFHQLSTVFDTALFDSQSDQGQVSSFTTHHFDNLYYTGCWNKAFELFPDFDVIWGIGGDCSLKCRPEEYRQAIESIYPFGLWSPTISGRAHDYMRPELALKRIFSVLFLEGMAMAISKELWTAVEPLDPVDFIGYSHDRRLSYLSRQMKLKNILDGRVELYHPPSESYDKEQAKQLMDKSLTEIFGPEWSDTLDWWPERRLSFLANAVSQVVLSDGARKLLAPFHRK
jgi:hypothetical protein